MRTLLLFALGMVLLDLACEARADPAATQPTVSSKPAVKDGLSVTVTLPKATFALDEPLKFTVQFKNASEKAITLYDADYFWGWTMQWFQVEGNTGPWKLRKLFKEDNRPAGSIKPLKPGEEWGIPVELVAGKGQFDFVWEGIQRRPVNPIPQLGPGQYRLIIQITLVENPGPVERLLPPYWIGTMTTEPVEFEMVDKPAPAPATQAGSVTEAQAKERAAKFAEKAGQKWGQPTEISKQGDEYWVRFETPQREMQLLSQRTIIVNASTGDCRFQMRR